MVLGGNHAADPGYWQSEAGSSSAMSTDGPAGTGHDVTVIRNYGGIEAPAEFLLKDYASTSSAPPAVTPASSLPAEPSSWPAFVLPRTLWSGYGRWSQGC